MQSESMEMMISAVECCSALHTVRALPLFSSFRPNLICILVKLLWALSIH